MLRRKRLEKRTRDERKAKRLEEHLKLVPGPKWKHAFTNLTIKPSRFVEMPEMKRVRLLPSLGVMANPHHHIKHPELDLSDEQLAALALREAKAQVEIERRKTMVAPLYNKGGYQYIGDAPPEIIRNLGKKI